MSPLTDILTFAHYSLVEKNLLQNGLNQSSAKAVVHVAVDWYIVKPQ